MTTPPPARAEADRRSASWTRAPASPRSGGPSRSRSACRFARGPPATPRGCARSPRRSGHAGRSTCCSLRLGTRRAGVRGRGRTGTRAEANTGPTAPGRGGARIGAGHRRAAPMPTTGPYYLPREHHHAVGSAATGPLWPQPSSGPPSATRSFTSWLPNAGHRPPNRGSAARSSDRARGGRSAGRRSSGPRSWRRPRGVGVASAFPPAVHHENLGVVVGRQIRTLGRRSARCPVLRPAQRDQVVMQAEDPVVGGGLVPVEGTVSSKKLSSRSSCPGTASGSRAM